MRKKVRVTALLSALVLGATAFAGCGASPSELEKQAAGGDASSSSSSQAVSASASSEDNAVSENTTSVSSASDQEPITIKACFAVGMTGAVNRFAIEKGLYEKEGINFDVTDFESNETTLSLISRGDVDVADGDPSTYIPGIQNGVPAKLVGNMWRYQGCYWLLAKNDIKSFADLKGKKIGTAGASGGMKLSVLKMLEANGISQDDVELVANGLYQDAYASFTSGEVDATIIHNPYVALAESEGTGHALGKAWDYIPDYYTGTIIASDRIIKEEPEKLQRFITAYYKVHEEVKNDYFDEFVKWAANYMNTDEDVMRNAIESEIEVWSDYPVIPEDRLYKTVEYLQKYGWMDKDVSPDGTFDNTFAKEAAKELGMKEPADPAESVSTVSSSSAS